MHRRSAAAAWWLLLAVSLPVGAQDGRVSTHDYAQWARSVSKQATGWGWGSSFKAAAVDRSGNLCVAGSIQSTGRYDFGAGMSLAGSEGYDAVLAMYDSSGAITWVQAVTSEGQTSSNQSPSQAGSELNAVAVDSTGNIYAAGCVYGKESHGFGAGVTLEPATVVMSAVLVKYAPTGKALWARSVTAAFDGSEYLGVAVDSAGSVYAAGRINGPRSVSFGRGVAVTGTSVGENAVVVKYSANGIAQWARSVTGSAGANGLGDAAESVFNAVAVDGSGSVYAAGGVIHPGRYSFARGISIDGDGGAIVKYDPAGKAIWARREAHSGLTAVAVDHRGSVYATGAALTKYDASGTLQWASKARGESSFLFQSVAVDDTGSAYAAGFVAGPGRCVFGYGAVVTAPPGPPGVQGSGAVIVKYGASGEAIAARIITTETGASEYTSVALDRDGNLFAAGFVSALESYTLGPAVGVVGTGIRSALAAKYRFDTPSPRAAAAAPVFRPQAGTYTTDQKIAITAAAGATIFYTADGSTPTFMSEVYDAPLSLGGDGRTFTLKAIAGKEGMRPSEVASGAFAVSFLLPQWARGAPAGVGSTLFEGLAADSQGNLYAAGSMSAAGSLSSEKALLVKYRASGKVVWSSAASGSAVSRFLAAASDTSGNVYAVGVIYGAGNCSFGAGVSVPAEEGAGDAVLVRFAPSGKAVWARKVSAAASAFYGVAVDAAGSAYVAGQIGPGHCSLGPGVSAYGVATGGNAVLAEYDASGEAKWVSSVTDGRADSIFRALAVDAAGNVFAVGSVGGKQRYVFGPGVEVTGISSRSNAVIVKCDKSGNAQWAKGPIAGSSDSDFKAVTVDGTGSPFAAGYIRGIQSYTFDPGSSVTGVSRAENALLVAYTSSGQAQWARSTTDGLGWSQFCAVAADDEGNLYTAGAIESAGSVTFGSGSKVGSESSSVVLVKYDSSGTARCARSVKEGSTGSAFNAIVIDGTGTLTTAGARIGAATCTFGPGVVSESGKETPSAALLVRYRFDSTATVKTPVIDLPAGTYGHDVGVAIGCATDGAVIHYTINGAEPDATGPVYDSPLWVTGDGTRTEIRAIAIREGMNPSAVVSGTYQISYAPAQWARVGTAGTESARFNAVASAKPVVYAAGFVGHGAAVAAFDAAGNALWLKDATAESAESSFQALVADQDGSFYAVGCIRGTGTCTFGPGVTASGTSQGSTMVLVKYDPSGNAQWARTATGGSSESSLDGIAMDGSGNLYVVGHIHGTETFVFGAGVAAAGASPGDNAVLVKYDQSGAAQWARSATGGPAESSFLGAAVDKKGNLYAVGRVSGQGPVSFGPGLEVRTWGTNPLIAKYDSAGTAQWARSVTAASSDTGSFEAQLSAVAVDVQGNPIAAGYFKAGSYTFGPNVLASAFGDRNLLLVKYGASGAPVFARTVRATVRGGSSFCGMTVDEFGNIYVAGYVSGNQYNNFPPSLQSVYGNGQTAVLVKYDLAGSARFVKSIVGASADSRFLAVAADGAGGLYAAGYVSGLKAYAFGPGESATGGSAGDNAVLVKYIDNTVAR